MDKYQDKISEHYERIWNNKSSIRRWREGPVHELPSSFCILEFEPNPQRKMWTYATCCMSNVSDVQPIELHLFSSERSDNNVELLTVIAHYHRTGSPLDLGHSVNFGRSWQENSLCTHGLISLPYLDGPALENLEAPGSVNKITKFYWLIPITQSEVNYKGQYGLEALEEKFDEVGVDYLDSRRKSVV